MFQVTVSCVHCTLFFIHSIQCPHPLSRFHMMVVKGLSLGTDFGWGDFNLTAERGDYESRLQQTVCWILLHILSHSQKRWWPTAHFIFKATKYFCKGAAFQDVDHQKDLVVHRERRVVHFPIAKVYCIQTPIFMYPSAQTTDGLLSRGRPTTLRSSHLAFLSNQEGSPGQLKLFYSPLKCAV